jgi:hypothetical protein
MLCSMCVVFGEFCVRHNRILQRTRFQLSGQLHSLQRGDVRLNSKLLLRCTSFCVWVHDVFNYLCLAPSGHIAITFSGGLARELFPVLAVVHSKQAEVISAQRQLHATDTSNQGTRCLEDCGSSPEPASNFVTDSNKTMMSPTCAHYDYALGIATHNRCYINSSNLWAHRIS